MNPNGGGSMCYVPQPSGGWVFTTGSITFNGSIASDSNIQQILTNVFTTATTGAAAGASAAAAAPGQRRAPVGSPAPR